MHYKGFEYSILQTANPTGWKWIVRLDENHTKVGSTFSRAFAINFAKQAIEKAAKQKRRPEREQRPMSSGDI